MSDLIVNELDTTTKCRVEGCRLTRPAHHKFRPRKSDTAACKTCGERGKWHPDHTFEPGYAATNPDILVACSCGIVAKQVESTSLSIVKNLQLAGWGFSLGEWKCPSCAQKAEKRAAKKAEKADPRQGSFL